MDLQRYQINVSSDVFPNYVYYRLLIINVTKVRYASPGVVGGGGGGGRGRGTGRRSQ